MSNSVNINVTANTSDAFAQFALLKAQLRAATADAKQYASTLSNTGQSVSQLGAAGQRLGAMQQNIKNLKDESNQLGKSLGLVSAGAHGATLSMGFLAREGHAMMDELLSGRMSQFQGTLANVTASILQAGYGFAVANPAIIAIGAAAAAAVGVFALFEIKAHAVSVATKELATSMAFAGNTKNFGGVEALNSLAETAVKAGTEVRTFADNFGYGTAISAEDAGKLGATVQGIQGSSAQLVITSEEVARSLKGLFPNDFQARQKEYLDFISDVDESLRKVVDGFGNYEDYERQAAKAALESGSANLKNAAALDLVKKKALDAANARGSLDAKAAKNSLDMTAFNGVDFAPVITGIDKAQGALEKTKKTTEDIERNLGGAADALRRMADTPQLQMNVGNQVLSASGSTGTQIDALEEKLSKLQKAAKATANSASGNDQDPFAPPPKDFNPFTDQGNRSPYGGLPKPEDTKKLIDLQNEIAKTQTAIRKLREGDSSGGSIDDQLKSATAQTQLTKGTDLLRDANTTLAFQQKALAQATAEGNTQEIRDINEKISATKLNIKQQQELLTAAKAHLAVSNAESNTPGEFNAKRAEIKANHAGDAPGSSGDIMAQSQLAEVNDQQEKQELAIKRQVFKQEFEARKESLEEEEKDIKEATAEHGQSYGQELAALKANLQQRKSAIDTYYAELLPTYTKGTAEYIDAITNQQVAKEKIDKQMVEATNNVNKQIYDGYKKNFEQIGSTVSSSIYGVITGQTRLVNAAKNIAGQILQSFIQARVKMVADWAAGIAAQTAQQQAGQAAQTAAVITGNAERTASTATSGEAQAAEQIAAISKSIMASAGETFAGIFGFLAPVMGPAAAGPAAAGEAAVMGAMRIPGYAVGAWKLPNDQVAQVHAGEMIVPAKQAQAFRQAVTGSSGNGSGGNTVNHSTNVVISAVDARSVSSMFQDNDSALMKTLSRASRQGVHLALRNLTGI